MWKEENNYLSRTFEFRDFNRTFSFMTRVAMLAEKMDHHPEMRSTYNKVEIRVYSHEEGEVTEKDLKLAAGIDELL
jgi:4a-hydroxytetrahydrobiopterin dehydratase